MKITLAKSIIDAFLGLTLTFKNICCNERNWPGRFLDRIHLAKYSTRQKMLALVKNGFYAKASLMLRPWLGHNALIFFLLLVLNLFLFSITVFIIHLFRSMFDNFKRDKH